MIVFDIFRAIAVLVSFGIFLQGFFTLKNVSRGYSTRKIIPSYNSFSTKDAFEGYHKNDPVSITSSGLSTDSDQHEPENVSHNDPVDQDSLERVLHYEYERLIVMVIDALRTDFMLGPSNYMPKTRKLLRRGNGLSFIAESHPPTVTLPRIKAITTGSIPNFFDVVLNFGSTALTEDNIVTQMKINKKKVVFFGDDTWMNLFPNHFERSDGTTSFFVMDYTEVDNNVTRHLEKELDKDADWDVMILHYLGLDHIGHSAGPRSPLVRPKLAEMDTIIARMYSALENWSHAGIPSLMLICGDHGMTDQGGHGGSTPEEISVPAVFLSPNIQATTELSHSPRISQTDLCPTLSVLLGLPVPMNSLGKVITDVLVDYDLEQKISVLHQNFQQVMRVFKNQVRDVSKESAFLMYEKAQKDYQVWLSKKNVTDLQQWEDHGRSILVAYSESIQLMAERIAKMAVQYDVYAMAASIVLLWLILGSLIISCHENDKDPKQANSITLKDLILLIPITGSALMTHITMCTVGVPSNLICSSSPFSITMQVTVAGIFVSCMLHMLTSWGRCLALGQWSFKGCFIEGFLICSTVMHTFTLLSSSFVEEEHQTFYFLTTSIHLLLLIRLVVVYVKKQNCKKAVVLKENEKKTEEGDSYYEQMPSADNTANERKYQSTTSSDKSFPNNEGSYEKVMDQNVLDKRGGELVQREVWDQNKKGSRNSQVPSPSLASIGAKDAMHVSGSLCVILFFLRILRAWNQTGDKWLHIPDIGDWFVEPRNKGHLSIAVIFSLLVIGTTRGRLLKRFAAACVNLSLVAVYLCRSAIGSLFFPFKQILSPKGITEAQVTYMFIALIVILSVLPQNFFKFERKESEEDFHDREKSIQSNEQEHLASSNTEQLSDVPRHGPARQEASSEDQHLSLLEEDGLSSRRTGTKKKLKSSKGIHAINGLLTAWLSLMCLLLRPHNIPLVAILSILEQLASHVIVRSNLSPTGILQYCLWMGQAFFFFQGNSNSVSTVDVSAGYIGVEDYNPVVIGSLIGVATFAGPIFWLLTYAKMIYLYQHSNDNTRPCFSYRSSFQGLMLTLALPLAVYSALVASQRYHLFVWTVFSPKLLYQAVYTIIVSSISLIFFLLTHLISQRK